MSSWWIFNFLQPRVLSSLHQNRPTAAEIRTCLVALHSRCTLVIAMVAYVMPMLVLQVTVNFLLPMVIIPCDEMKPGLTITNPVGPAEGLSHEAL
jgi:hypothetical protein